MANKSSINIKLNPGVVTVLCGPQGCGKSTIAKHIAKAYGKFIEDDSMILSDDDAFKELLCQGAATIILDGAPTRAGMAVLKSLITHPEINVRVPYESTSRATKTPNFIICTDEVDALGLGTNDRRFYVVKLKRDAVLSRV